MPKLRGCTHLKCFENQSPDTISSANAGFDSCDDTEHNDVRFNGTADASDYIVDIREYDVPYHVRVAIDKGSSAISTRSNGRVT